ncbi:MAG TPA: hypothetical protein VK980_15850 [Sphingomonas sp.]|nr:hypothetical protein [Sphingomonas sp.]
MKYIVTLGLSALATTPAAGQEAPSPLRHAAGTEFTYATDSDGTEVVHAAIDFDLRNVSENDRLGIAIEKAWYRPANGPTESRDRAFLNAAGERGKWQWHARVGTDGDTIIGSISLNDTRPFRKELFVERDLVETRQGLQRGIYATFVGAALDLPVDDRNTFTTLAGLQAFTGDNLRLHLRGSYIHVVKPDWGLSVQLRGRYFKDSDPREFDYYSPRWFAQMLPVVQVRRFVGGWELVGAGGIGAQRDSDSKWRQSRFAQARFRSPIRASRWSVNGTITYSNTPAFTETSDSGYSFLQVSLGISRRF